MLKLVRIAVVSVYFILITLVSLLLCILRPFHRNNTMLAGRIFSSMAYVLGLKIIVRRSPEVNEDEPCVYIANHQNSYDIFTICRAIVPGTVSLGKRSLVYIPLFGWLYWLSGNILIDRKNKSKARDTLGVAIKKIIERRISVWVFPEGTRSYGRGLLPFKTGAFRIAKEADEAVSMICASNTHEKIDLNRWNNGVMIIEITPPVKMDDSRTLKEWALWFHDEMEVKLEALNKEVEVIEADLGIKKAKS